MRMARVLAGVALLSAVGTGVATADFRDFSNICQVGGLRSCASIQLFTTINSNNTTTVTLRVRNLEGTPIWGNMIDATGGSFLTRVGIVAPATGAATGLTVGTLGVVGSSGNPFVNRWALRQPGGLNTPIVMDVNASAGGGIRGCNPANVSYTDWFETCSAHGNTGWVVFTFTTASPWSANNAVVGFMTTDYTNTWGPTNSWRNNECDTQGTTPNRTLCEQIVPEPVTMLLLGTGLAGMGGVGLIRRRRGGNDIQNG